MGGGCRKPPPALSRQFHQRSRLLLGGSRRFRTRYPPPQRRPGCRQRTVTVGPGCSSVTVTVGPGRGTVTVTVGWGTGTLTVKVGAGFPPCCRLVEPRTAGVVRQHHGTVIATISASPLAAAIASMALDRSRFRSFLRCLLRGRGACGVITPLMVNLSAACADVGAAELSGYGRSTKRGGRTSNNCAEIPRRLSMTGNGPQGATRLAARRRRMLNAALLPGIAPPLMLVAAAAVGGRHGVRAHGAGAWGWLGQRRSAGFQRIDLPGATCGPGKG